METINILFYNTMWGAPLALRQEELPAGCLITTDRKLLPTADAVVFHLPDLQWSMDTDEIIKPEGQIWVAWNLECEENYPRVKQLEFKDNFDLWMGYHKNDDIIYPYYKTDYEKKLLNPISTCKRKNKTCMFISSPINQSHRREYLAELMKHTEIDSYGKLFNNMTLTEDKGEDTLMRIISEYKFVIGFENAIAQDYVTEKFYNPLLAGTVPVYRGAPNINDFVPGMNCFLDANTFDSPIRLAEYIEKCYREEAYYEHFHKWKSFPILSSFREKLEGIQLSPFYRLCQNIKDIRLNNLKN